MFLQKSYGGKTSDKVGENAEAQKDDLSNKFKKRSTWPGWSASEGGAGGYVHHNAANGVRIEFEGGNADVVKDIAMHTAAMRP